MGNQYQIYVADLSAYNEGSLVGQWIDVDSFANDKEELFRIIKEEILKTCDFCKSHGMVHEEWAIHDYEYFPDLGEYPDWDRLVEIAEVLSNFTDEEHKEAFSKWIVGDADNRNPGDFEDAFRGIWDSEKEYGEDLADEMIPGLRDGGELANYFDYDRYTWDQFNHGPFSSARLSTYNYAIYEEVQ